MDKKDRKVSWSLSRSQSTYSAKDIEKHIFKGLQLGGKLDPGLLSPVSSLRNHTFMSHIARSSIMSVGPAESPIRTEELQIQVQEALGVTKLKEENESLQERLRQYKRKVETLEVEVQTLEHSLKDAEESNIAQVFRDLKWRQAGLMNDGPRADHNRKRPGLPTNGLPLLREPQRRALELHGRPHAMTAASRQDPIDDEWEQYADAQEQLTFLQQTFNDNYARLSSQKALVNARHKRMMGLLSARAEHMSIAGAESSGHTVGVSSKSSGRPSFQSIPEEGSDLSEEPSDSDKSDNSPMKCAERQQNANGQAFSNQLKQQEEISSLSSESSGDESSDKLVLESEDQNQSTDMLTETVEESYSPFDNSNKSASIPGITLDERVGEPHATGGAGQQVSGRTSHSHPDIRTASDPSQDQTGLSVNQLRTADSSESAGQSPKTPARTPKFPYRTAFLASAYSSSGQSGIQTKISRADASDESLATTNFCLPRKLQSMKSIELRSDSPRDQNSEISSPSKVEQVLEPGLKTNASWKWDPNGSTSQSAQEIMRIRSVQLETERHRLWQSAGADPEFLKGRIKDLDEREAGLALRTMQLEAREHLVKNQEQLADIALTRSIALDRREADLKARELHLRQSLAKHQAREQEVSSMKKRIVDLERLLGIFTCQPSWKTSCSRPTWERSRMYRSLSTTVEHNMLPQ